MSMEFREFQRLSVSFTTIIRSLVTMSSARQDCTQGVGSFHYISCRKMSLTRWMRISAGMVEIRGLMRTERSRKGVPRAMRSSKFPTDRRRIAISSAVHRLLSQLQRKSIGFGQRRQATAKSRAGGGARAIRSISRDLCSHRVSPTMRPSFCTLTRPGVVAKRPSPISSPEF